MVLSWAVFLVSLKLIWHNEFKGGVVYFIQEKKWKQIVLYLALGRAEEKTTALECAFLKL